MCIPNFFRFFIFFIFLLKSYCVANYIDFSVGMSKQIGSFVELPVADSCHWGVKVPSYNFFAKSRAMISFGEISGGICVDGTFYGKQKFSEYLKNVPDKFVRRARDKDIENFFDHNFENTYFPLDSKDCSVSGWGISFSPTICIFDFVSLYIGAGINKYSVYFDNNHKDLVESDKKYFKSSPHYFAQLGVSLDKSLNITDILGVKFGLGYGVQNILSSEVSYSRAVDNLKKENIWKLPKKDVHLKHFAYFTTGIIINF